MKFKLIVVVLFVSIIFFCAQEKIKKEEFPDYYLISDIPYKNAGSDYEMERCKLDLYLPKGKKKFPALVWFHGGSLKHGDKTVPMVTIVGKRFAKEGIAVALVNYRLNPNVNYPAYIEDAAGAVGWVIKNIARFNGDARYVFVGGHSAGAYLTAMVGLDEHYLQAYQLGTDRIAGLIPISGQMYSHSTVREERGISQSEKIIDETAPLFHIRKNAPPLISVCADSDVVLADNQFFVESLKKTGHEQCEFIEVPNRNHGTIVSEIENPDDEVAARMLRFMREVIKR